MSTTQKYVYPKPLVFFFGKTEVPKEEKYTDKSFFGTGKVKTRTVKNIVVETEEDLWKRITAHVSSAGLEIYHVETMIAHSFCTGGDAPHKMFLNNYNSQFTYSSTQITGYRVFTRKLSDSV